MEHRKYKEFLLYAVVNITALFFNWCVYSIFVVICPMFLANAVSWCLTTLFAFLMNKIYVFESKIFYRNIIIKELVSFISTRGATGCLEVFLQPQFYELGMTQSLFGVKGLQAKIVVCLFLSIINYVSTKLFVFRGQQKGVKSA